MTEVGGMHHGMFNLDKHAILSVHGHGQSGTQSWHDYTRIYLVVAIEDTRGISNYKKKMYVFVLFRLISETITDFDGTFSGR